MTQTNRFVIHCIDYHDGNPICRAAQLSDPVDDLIGPDEVLISSELITIRIEDAATGHQSAAMFVKSEGGFTRARIFMLICELFDVVCLDPAFGFCDPSLPHLADWIFDPRFLSLTVYIGNAGDLEAVEALHVSEMPH